MDAVISICYVLYNVICIGNLDTCNSTCVMDEVTCTCRPLLRLFNWVIQATDGVQTTIPFAGSPNGTIEVRERYSTEAFVIYNENNVITSFLTFTAHPELHGATITCDQYSITFNILGNLYDNNYK